MTRCWSYVLAGTLFASGCASEADAPPSEPLVEAEPPARREVAEVAEPPARLAAVDLGGGVVVPEHGRVLARLDDSAQVDVRFDRREMRTFLEHNFPKHTLVKVRRGFSMEPTEASEPTRVVATWNGASYTVTVSAVGEAAATRPPQRPKPRSGSARKPRPGEAIRVGEERWIVTEPPPGAKPPPRPPAAAR